MQVQACGIMYIRYFSKADKTRGEKLMGNRQKIGFILANSNHHTFANHLILNRKSCHLWREENSLCFTSHNLYVNDAINISLCEGVI
jgi:hypothetical protein